MIKEIVQFMMELSSVFNRIHFLLELKNAPGEDRIIILEYITRGQMACIGEIARRIYHHTFPLFILDLAYFEDRSLVLRVLFSLRVSFRDKSSHTCLLPQNLVNTSTNVLPPGHNPRSNTISTRILVYHNMRSRWWWWWWVVVVMGGGGGGWWWWVVVMGGGGGWWLW